MFLTCAGETFRKHFVPCFLMTRFNSRYYLVFHDSIVSLHVYILLVIIFLDVHLIIAKCTTTKVSTLVRVRVLILQCLSQHLVVIARPRTVLTYLLDINVRVSHKLKNFVFLVDTLSSKFSDSLVLLYDPRVVKCLFDCHSCVSIFVK